jgi:uncharacterized UBP type Zn finger protein
MACPHLETLAPALKAPTAVQSVYREDCTQCFDSIVGSELSLAFRLRLYSVSSRTPLLKSPRTAPYKLSRPC